MATTAPRPLNQHLVVSSSDLEEVVSAGSKLFSPHRLRCRAVDATLAAMPLNTLTLVSMQYRGGSVVETAQALGYYAVHLPLSGHGLVHFRGEDVATGPNSAVVFGPHDEPAMRWSADLTQVAFTVPAETLHTHLAKLTARPGGRQLTFARSARTGRSVAADNWMNTLRMVVKMADSYRRQALPPTLVASLEDMLLTSLLMTQPNNWTKTLYSGVASAAPNAVALAIEMIEAEPEENWGIARLAAETGVSARSLQEGFRRAKGVSPTAYVKNVRLDLARKRLADPDFAADSIADIAFGVGFTHLGRFAAGFRQRFGVKPSQIRGADSGAARPLES